jgi:hypothetical protein
MKLADLMFTEADILKELDALIKRIDAKIGEIQGDTETNTVQFSY